jgi:hypothetical protein
MPRRTCSARRREGRLPGRSPSSREAGESNPAGRFWRPARSQLASHILWVTARLRSGTFAFTARRAGPLHHGHHAGQGGWICPSDLRFPKPALIYPSSTLMCSRLESNQHLLDFSQAPSPDRLQERMPSRIGVRPGASSAIRLSKTRKRTGSGTRNRTSIDRVKACRPAIGRSPSIWFSGGSGRTRTCVWAVAQTDLRSAPFAARMHAPPHEARAGSSVSRWTPEMKKAAEVSLGGLASNEDSFALNRPSSASTRSPG